VPHGLPQERGALHSPEVLPNLSCAVQRPGESDDGREQAWERCCGGSPPQSAFYNTTTFQIHSKGPDRKTGWNRGLDPDDVNNYGISEPGNR